MRLRNHSLGRAIGARSILLALSAAAHIFAASPPPMPPPQPAGSLFQDRHFGPLPPPTQAPTKRLDLEEDKPIPPEWIYGGLAAAAIISAFIFWRSARLWRSSNLFDQQYRFPPNPQPALRFGAHRCGGNMATIRLENAAARPQRRALKTEDV